jgi:hypothetical protein
MRKWEYGNVRKEKKEIGGGEEERRGGNKILHWAPRPSLSMLMGRDRKVSSSK